MPKRCYQKINLGSAKLDIIEQANEIIEDYRTQGYILSLRQIFYRFIAKDLFPESWIDESYNLKNNLDPQTKNTEKNYKKLGTILGDGRMAGLIDWNGIEDRGRSLNGISHWQTPADIVRTCSKAFHLDRWVGQDYRCEVWVEKSALEEIATKAAHPLDVSVFSCRGYGSLSSLWEASQRLKRYVEAGQKPVIIHLGDHDPSGLDMTRDIKERLNQFLWIDWYHDHVAQKSKGGNGYNETKLALEQQCGVAGIKIDRVALNMDQVRKYDPPPNPAKVTDHRFKGYEAKYGSDSWELDALEPSVLDALITKSILNYLDREKYNELLRQEEVHCQNLGKAAHHWDRGLAEQLKGMKPPPPDPD